MRSAAGLGAGAGKIGRAGPGTSPAWQSAGRIRVATPPGASHAAAIASAASCASDAASRDSRTHRALPSRPPRSLLLNRGAQVPDQRQKARSDVALEQIGPELERGPTAPDDDWFRSGARVERRRNGIDVAAPVSECEAIAVLLVVAERLFETLPRQRAILRSPRADLLEDGLALLLQPRADIG